VDQAGNQCEWDADVAAIVSKNQALVGVYGSPCRPAKASGDPWMEMYATEDYSNNITLGERGIIIDMHLSTKEGSFVLDAVDCVRAARDGNPQEGWTVNSGSWNASNFIFAENNDQSWTWRVTDPGSGILTIVTCIAMEIQGQDGNPRLDISNIVDPKVGRSAPSDGFCVTGVIDTQQATSLNVQLNSYCEDMSDARYAQILVDPSANSVDDDISVRRWCDLAVMKPSEKPQCFQKIFGAGTINTGAWNQLLCEVNNIGASSTSAVSSCVRSIESMGLESYVQLHGPGYSLATQSDVRCGLSEDDYGLQLDEDSCQMGVFVEYEESPNVWVQELFIPADYEPCNGKLSITAATHPNLFLHPIRLRQCELSAQCTIENKCQPVAGFEGTLMFTGCP